MNKNRDNNMKQEDMFQNNNTREETKNSQNPYYNNMNSSKNNSRQGARNSQKQYYNNSQQDFSQNSINTQQPSSMDSLWGSFDTSNFLKGMAIGAIGAYLLTNENAQKTIFKAVAKGGEMFNGGMEEMKERYEDAKAEIEAEK